LKTWILLQVSVLLIVALVYNGLLVGQASNSTKITTPKKSKDLTSEDRVLIKLTPSGTTAEGKVTPKNIKVKAGTTVVWQSTLPEKVYVQSKPSFCSLKVLLSNCSGFIRFAELSLLITRSLII